MKSATIPEIKKTLQSLEGQELIDLCLRLAKYKKDNKELLNYLLFESMDEALFVQKVKEEMDLYFDELPRTNTYLIKKGLRKTLKVTNKYIKYNGNKATEIDLLIYFCLSLKKKSYSNIVWQGLGSIWEVQLRKIEKIILSLHEDLQYDYRREIEKLLA